MSKTKTKQKSRILDLAVCKNNETYAIQFIEVIDITPFLFKTNMPYNWIFPTGNDFNQTKR